MTSHALFDLRHHTAIITGGAGILGHHFCTAMAASGANVVIADFDGDKAETLAQEIGTQALAIEVNITDPKSVADMITATQKHFGQITVLHNNAASKSKNIERFFDPTDTFSTEIWQEIMDVNVRGYFEVARQAAHVMQQQGKGGSIIQTASIYGIMAPDQRIYEGSEYLGRPINTPAVYSASKASVVGLTKYLASYWAQHNIRVNTLTPGGVESGQNNTFKENYARRVPLGRMAKPEEMIGALLFLASDASTYITGQNIIVDGGLSCW